MQTVHTQDFVPTIGTILALMAALCPAGCGSAGEPPADAGPLDGGVTTPARDAGTSMPSPPIPPTEPRDADSGLGCTPGRYVGRYACKEGFAGPVSFDLVTETTPQDEDCTGEFCADFVISEASGELRGDWIILAFAGRLEGGLDCTSGAFRATLVDGRAGLPDPNDPSGIIGFNSFGGSLEGAHDPGPPELITGTWSLTNADSSCVGSFSVERQP